MSKDRSYKTRGYRVKRVKSLEDLRELEMDYLLDTHAFDDIEGLYFDVPGEAVEFEAVEESEITFGAVVHGKLFPRPVKAYRDAKGETYIGEPTFYSSLWEARRRGEGVLKLYLIEDEKRPRWYLSTTAPSETQVIAAEWCVRVLSGDERSLKEVLEGVEIPEVPLEVKACPKTTPE